MREEMSLVSERILNVCPVCRNVNQPDATVCQYCRAALTPPQPAAAEAAPQPRRWRWAAGGVALLLVAGLAGFSFLGGGGGQAAAATALAVGTGAGPSLVFEPRSIQAPPNTSVSLTFNNQSTLPHNLTFEQVITAKTAEQLAGGASQTITFTTPGPGTYRFVCTIHPGMDGQLVVQ